MLGPGHGDFQSLNLILAILLKHRTSRLEKRKRAQWPFWTFMHFSCSFVKQKRVYFILIHGL